MRLAFANNYLYLRGGSERVMFDEMGWLRARGVEVAAFGRRQPECADFPHAELFPPLHDLRQGGGASWKVARDIIYNRDTGARFRRFSERVRPALLHAHNIYAGLTTAVLDAAREAEIPSIVTLHDYKLACPSYTMMNHGRLCERCVGRSFWGCLRTRCHRGSLPASLISTIEATFNQWRGKWRQARFLICPSRFLRDVIVRHGYPAEQVRCIPNGIDPARFTPSWEDGPYCLYLGRLSHEKGIYTLIEAMQGVKLPLRVVGDGPERQKLEARVCELGLRNVVFDGYQQGEALAQRVRGAAFVIVPSEWYENASMAVLETMAYGKAIIASRIGGIPEQVADGETGLLLEPGAVAPLREAIVSLAEQRTRRLALGRAGRARLETQFSLQRHGERLLQLYEEVLGGSGHAFQSTSGLAANMR
jgi:glycosyltransferase involved in cell wall biosynthesis